jgi:hypothetical protein
MVAQARGRPWQIPPTLASLPPSERDKRLTEQYNRLASALRHFGHVATPVEAPILSRLVHTYLATLAHRDYKAACAMSTTAVRRVKVHAGDIQANTCERVLALLLESLIGTVDTPRLGQMTVREVRVSGIEGYALLSRNKGRTPSAFLPIRQEEARWRLNGQVPLPLHLALPAQ